MTRLFVAAAEPSGDRLAADLVGELRRRIPDLSVSGLTGPRSRAAGVRSVADTDAAGVVGLVEALAAFPRARRLVRAAAAHLAAERPAACVTVDAPSLLLRVARSARRVGVPALHVVAPQVWAWRPGRARTVAEDVDLLLCLFPFEPVWFAGHVRAVFVGHPAAAVVPRPVAAPGAPTIALCPGSRGHEIRTLWPVFRRVMDRIRRARPEAGFLVPVAPGVDPAPFLGHPGVRTVAGLAEVAGADAALVASGTATLELAALDVPMVVVYRVHPLTAAIARRLVTVPFVALPNVLAGRRVVPEHLQTLDPDALARELLGLVGRRGQVPRALVDALDGPRALGRMAAEIRPYVGG